MLYNRGFFLVNLQMCKKVVPLQCVFHSIRFKVNKGWSKALLLFFYAHTLRIIQFTSNHHYINKIT